MRKLTQGNEAVFRGAVAAGADYFAGYPISPSTEILNVASGWAADHPEFRFLQAEDEIASANAIIGASLAGAKSFTATSGPGFSLMQEAVGYAQKVGVPCVFVVQRWGRRPHADHAGAGRRHAGRCAAPATTPFGLLPRRVEEAFRVQSRLSMPRSRSRRWWPLRHVRGLNEVVGLNGAGGVEWCAHPRPARKHGAGKRASSRAC
jgi:2-oxoglutarate ferredoxin oxidoreductase subunit alpha